MICAVEWNHLFCDLQSFKISFIYSIFLRNLCGQPVLIFFFHKWDLSQVCGKQHPINPPEFLYDKCIEN